MVHWLKKHSKSNVGRIACAFQVLVDGFTPLDIKEISFADKNYYFI
jgi:hypothetical protein